jgi:hypothetical protein
VREGEPGHGDRFGIGDELDPVRARALGFEQGQTIEREPYDLLFGERKAPDGTQLGRSPGIARKAADVYAALLAAEPHATAERKRELRLPATKQARQSPLFFDLTISLSKSISLFHASLGECPPGPPGRRQGRRPVLDRVDTLARTDQ